MTSRNAIPLLAALLLVSCSVERPEKETARPRRPAPTRKPLEEVAEEPERPALNPSRKRVPMKEPNILQARGTEIVNAKGERVELRGCNLGNWFLLEMWMLDIHDIRDQHEFELILERRFGRARKDRLMDVYRANWIRERDFPIVSRFGFNTVRLPFHYSLLEDDARPFELKPDAFRWLDHAVDLAEQHGLYVILDLHGVQGGQSDDHTTGQAGQNKLWDSKRNQERVAWLWGEISLHYKDSETVAAYDVINEPFGAQSEERRKILVDLFDLIYHSIRKQDSKHIIFAPGTYAGFAFYGDPKDHGWENVGFTHHFYPGLFGQDPLRETHMQFISRTLPPIEAHLEEVQAPFLVGEFNAVFRRVGGAALMRHYFDLYNSKGWAATMWCYKLLHREGGMGVDTWSMVCNKQPLPAFNLRTSTEEEIENYFEWLGTMKYDLYENLGAAMTMETPPPLNMPEMQINLFEPPYTNDPSPWAASDINRALPGGQQVLSETAMEIYGGGSDIWSNEDQFRFLWQEVQGEFELTARIKGLADTHPYAKAGLMLRASLDPDSPHVLVNVFPDGQVLLAVRAETGGDTEQKTLDTSGLPITLRMRRSGDLLEIGFTPERKEEAVKKLRVPMALRHKAYAGLAVLSHDNRCLTTAEFEDIRFRSAMGRLR